MFKCICSKLKTCFHHTVMPPVFLVFSTLWLRFFYLSWSNYQGDEIKAMYRPDLGQTMWQFLIEQRKGPLQFLITYLLKFATPDYYNVLVMRLPFAIAGTLAILFFYKMLKMHFGRKIALFAALFLSLNGFLVAFSRIVQYQSFTILLFILALYYFSLALHKDTWKYKGWYLGMVVWGLSALSHYDAIFIAPFVIYIMWEWYKKYKSIPVKTRIIHLLSSSVLCGLIVLAFYIPYVLSLTDSQLDYWVGRLSDSSVKISSSIYLFRIYNPLVMLKLYLGFALIGLFKIKKIWPVFVWFVFPFLFMEVLTDIPGTHIYTYLIPTTVLMAFGLVVTQNVLNQITKKFIAEKIFYLLISVLFLFNFLLTHTLFVDHSPEYPWQNKQFMFWTLHKPEVRYHLSIFGFPYYRHWEEIQAHIRENGTEGYLYYGTNDKKSIPRFYMEGYKKEGALAEYYVHVKNPQSFSNEILQEKPYKWIRNMDMEPEITYTNGEKEVVHLYRMPQGDSDNL